MSEISDRGLALYRERLKPLLEPKYNGHTVAIHLASGDYPLARSSSEVRRDLRSRHSEGPIVTMLVGPYQMDQLARRMLGGEFLTGHAK